jgi:cysteine desulfurase
MFFPNEAYLDNNATTRIDKSVIRVMHRVLKKYYGNPSSLYKAAHFSKAVLEDSRRTCAAAINASDEEIIFTGCASEANNQVLLTLFERCYPEKRTIISSPIEHPSVISTLNHLEKKGAVVRYIPVDATGIIDMEILRSLINNDTLLVCCMLANNETGSVQDIKTVSAIARTHGAFVFSDCVQALGKIPVDVKELDLDYASFSAHKIHGPKGVGALYIKNGSPISPFIHGGHQETGLRAGTEGLHNIAGFAQAVRKLPCLLKNHSKTDGWKKYFIERLKEIKPDIIINTPPVSSLPNTASITFPGIDNAVLIAVFDYYGIAVSAGSACSTPDNKASHVLKAIGLTDEQARTSIRFSLSGSTTKRDINYTLKVIKKYLSGKTPQVGMIAPAFLNESLLFDNSTYILDIRFWYDKVKIKSLPGAHEASFFSFNKYLYCLPRNKNIIVVCQGGFYSPMIAFYCKRKGFKNVGFLMTGMEGWKTAQPELYKKFAGQNIIRLEPRGKHAILPS